MGFGDDLIAAADAGDATQVAALIDGASAADVSHVNADGWCAAVMAAKHGNLGMLEALVAAGADVHNKRGAAHTCIRGAAIGGHTAVVDYLLDLGVPVDSLSAGHRTPLMGAAMNGRADCVALLLERGADRTIKNDFGETAADLAKDAGVKALLA